MAGAPCRLGSIRGGGPAAHGQTSAAGPRRGRAEAGLGRTRTILVTGGVAIRAKKDDAEIRGVFVRVIRVFGPKDAAFVRRRGTPRGIAAADPPGDAAFQRPIRPPVRPPGRPAGGEVARNGPERIAVRGREVLLDHREGVGRSKPTGAVLWRLLGREGTARNWTTLRRLAGLGAPS